MHWNLTNGIAYNDPSLNQIQVPLIFDSDVVCNIFLLVSSLDDKISESQIKTKLINSNEGNYGLIWIDEIFLKILAISLH